MKAKEKTLPASITVLLILSSSRFLPASAGDENWDSNFGVPGANGTVLCMVAAGDKLYAGGDFTQIGGVDANYIAQWNGADWSPLGLGTGGTVGAMLLSGTDLYVAGAFNNAGASSATKHSQVAWCELDCSRQWGQWPDLCAGQVR